MYRAIAPRNCTRLMNSFRGWNGSKSSVPCCWQMSQRNMSSDLSPWNFWNQRSRNPFRQLDNELSRFMNDMERSVFPYTGQGFGLTRPGSARVWMNKKEFEVNVDVNQFEPEDIHVKLADNKLTISGKHETKADEYGTISREFVREFSVPENVDTETMTSTVTDEGILVIRAKVKPDENPKNKNVNIEIERENKA